MLKPFAVAALLAVSGLSSPGLAEQPKYGGTLRVGAVDDLKTLNPLVSAAFGERKIMFLLYNTLVTLRPDFSVGPSLAKSWEVSPDGLALTFQLQEGVKFHDGTPLNAEAVKWNYDKRLDPETRSNQTKVLARIIQSVDVIDDFTVRFSLKEPSPSFLTLLCERPGYMVSPTAYQKHGADFGSNPVGTGAFVLEGWDRGRQVVVKRNENYWKKDLPYLDKVVFSDTAGALIGVQRLRAGELDFVAELTPQDVAQLQSDSSVNLHPITGRWYLLQWHVDTPPFNDQKLRRAIAHAIDRKRINAIIMLGQGTIANSPTPPGFWWFNEKAQIPEHNVAKAKQLLKEAGIGKGFKLTLSTPTLPIFNQMNQLVAEQLGAVGIDVKLEPIAVGDYYSRIQSGATNFTPVRWTQRADPDGLYNILFHKDGVANTTRYDNAEVTKLIGAARTTYDQAARKTMYFKVQEHMAADLPVIPILFAQEYAAVRDGVENFEWIPDQIPRFEAVWKK